MPRVATWIIGVDDDHGEMAGSERRTVHDTPHHANRQGNKKRGQSLNHVCRLPAYAAALVHVATPRAAAGAASGAPPRRVPAV